MRKPTPASGQAAKKAPATAPTPPVTTAPADTVMVVAEAPAASEPAPVASETDLADDHADDQLIDARVLVAFEEHQPDDLIALSIDAIEILELDGKVDSHPDAVAYARTLGA